MKEKIIALTPLKMGYRQDDDIFLIFTDLNHKCSCSTVFGFL